MSCALTGTSVALGARNAIRTAMSARARMLTEMIRETFFAIPRLPLGVYFHFNYSRAVAREGNRSVNADPTRYARLSKAKAYRKSPVRWNTKPTASGPKYPPRLPRAFTSPIAAPETERGRVSVGIAQNDPRIP